MIFTFVALLNELGLLQIFKGTWQACKNNAREAHTFDWKEYVIAAFFGCSVDGSWAAATSAGHYGGAQGEEGGNDLKIVSFEVV